MSGCAVCVHDLYVDAIQSYTSSLHSAREFLVDRGVHSSLWPVELLHLGKKREGPTGDDLLDIADPSTRAFVLMEREMKRKHEQQQQTPSE